MAAVNGKPNLVRKGICNIKFLYLQYKWFKLPGNTHEAVSSILVSCKIFQHMTKMPQPNSVDSA